METNILGIESSCDDTSVAVYSKGKILANVTANQDVHSKWGGVVPELASRAHIEHIIPTIDAALRMSGLSKGALDAIGFTRGPGLIGSLLVGCSVAKALAIGLKIPIIEVNHMQAHVNANLIGDDRPSFPYLCLTVSGGHTQLVKVNSELEMVVIGETRDDAAGEAFDKTAKLLGFPYPGGPLIDKNSKNGDPDRFTFGKPKLPGLEFSFSGLKTSVLYFLNKQKQVNEHFVEENLIDLCASIQKSICDMLLEKVEKAAIETGITEVALAGGVSANSELRRRFEKLGVDRGWKTYIPEFEYCTDNAAMIAITAHYKYLKKEFAEQNIEPMARYKF